MLDLPKDPQEFVRYTIKRAVKREFNIDIDPSRIDSRWSEIKGIDLQSAICYKLQKQIPNKNVREIAIILCDSINKDIEIRAVFDKVWC